MKTTIQHSALIVLLITLITSCASNEALCPAYTYTPNEEIKMEEVICCSLEPIESEGLKEKPRGFQWEENIVGPNGGTLD